jgi:hypothetical protein
MVRIPEVCTPVIDNDRRHASERHLIDVHAEARGDAPNRALKNAG